MDNHGNLSVEDLFNRTFECVDPGLGVVQLPNLAAKLASQWLVPLPFHVELTTEQRNFTNAFDTIS